MTRLMRRACLCGRAGRFNETAAITASTIADRVLGRILFVLFFNLLLMAQPSVLYAQTVKDIKVGDVPYKVLIFKGNRAWVAPANVKEVEYLIVGGGGGGDEGGGGGGGFREGETTVTPGTTYQIWVGVGGPPGKNGQDSSALGIVAKGGGGGGGERGGRTSYKGGDGGSGGGATANGTGGRHVGKGTPRQGHDGGVSGRSEWGGGGGGGGAGGPGKKVTGSVSRYVGRGGNGGDGKSSSITGQQKFYAGGGGGGANIGTKADGQFTNAGGVGGSGGGGRGARNDRGTGDNGNPNTGGGGGGSEVQGNGSKGGSGIVIIRYVATPKIAVTSSESGGLTDGRTDDQGEEPAGTAKTVTYTVTNSGTANLALDTATATGTPDNVKDVTITDPVKTTLVPGEETRFTVSYTPEYAGAFSFGLTIGNNSTNAKPFDFTVRGKATGNPEIKVELKNGTEVNHGGAHARGRKPAGTAETVQYTVRNIGTANLTLKDVTSDKLSNVKAVTITGPKKKKLARNETATFTVSYTPEYDGAFSFILGIPNNDADKNPFNFTVSGRATGDPVIVVASKKTGATIADGGKDVQAASVAAGQATPLIYRVRNTGLAELTLQDVTVPPDSKDNIKAVTITGPKKKKLAPGQETEFTVSYTPTIAGTFAFGLTFGNNDLDKNPFNFTVSGKATGDPVIVVELLNRTEVNHGGTDAQGRKPAGQAVTVIYRVRNTGLAELTLQDVTVIPDTKDNIKALTITNPDPKKLPLAPGQETTFTVSYTPDKDGPFSFRLNLPNNSTNAKPFNFTVRGVGTADPVITVPADITVNTDPGKPTARVFFTGKRAAKATDHDGIKSLTYSPASGHDFPTGAPTKVTVTATDETGKSSQASFTVTVIDKEKPKFTFFPDDITIEVDYPLKGAVATWKEPVAADNVDETVTPEWVSSAPAKNLKNGDEFPLGATTVTYEARDAADNPLKRSFTVSVNQIPPGSVTFVVNAAVDGAFPFTSAEPALNVTVNARDGSGKSDVIKLRPGSYDVSFAAPDGFGITSAVCSPDNSKLDAGTKKGTIVLASGVAVTCTIDALDSRGITSGRIGSFMQARSELILANQPDLERRLDRLNGRMGRATSISGFGLSLSHPALPFSARLGRDKGSFAWSLRNTHAQSGKAALNADLGAIAGALGIPRSDDTAGGHNAGAPVANWKRSGGSASGSGKGKGGASNGVLALGPTSRDISTGGDPEADSAADPMARRFDVWAQGTYAAFSASGGKGRFAIVHAGADYLVNPNLLIGLGLQADWTTMDASKGAQVKGYGFMVGPYATARLADGFYADARIAWGRSFNKISPFGTYTDPFRAERWLGSAALIGETSWNMLTIRPELRLSWFRERSKAYVDTLGVAIPAVKVETGTLEFGPTFTLKPFEIGSGLLLTPHLTVEGIWTFAQTNTATTVSQQPGLGETGVRGRVEAGLNLADDNGTSVNASAFYDGLGNADFKAWGAKLSVHVSF